MKLLFDTHTFLWWDSEPTRLSATALAACQDTANLLLISVASIWEIQIKRQLGRLQLSLPLEELIDSQRHANQVDVLPVTLPHVLALETLPAYHKDPFDRLLIAQTNVEGAILVSHDRLLTQYPVSVLW
jgi:PIN domain nuclease of toxin-antitoxin system